MAQTHRTRPERRPPTSAPPKQRHPEDVELLDDSDDLLDEIDRLLEDQEALTTYRQRGGE